MIPIALKRWASFMALAAAVATIASAQTGADPSSSAIRDPRDGQRYDVVAIGGREWLARNLAFDARPSWCYGDQPAGCEGHGRLYQWDTAVKACPAGWRLPTDRDWMDLEAALGMPAGDLGREGPRGSDQGAQLRARGRTRLEILISGYRRPAGDYARRNERAAFWTATESNAEDAWHRDIRGDVDTIYRSPVTKSYALSVRCIR